MSRSVFTEFLFRLSGILFPIFGKTIVRYADFGISRYSEDGIKILYHLVKSRADLHYPTVFNTQYEPSEWGKWLSDDPECFGKLDGIRRRLTTGFTVEIVKL